MDRVDEQESGSRGGRGVRNYSSFSEYIDKELLPHALLWGIPYAIFYDLDFRSIKPFQESYRIKCREDADIMNHNAWLIGRYICESIATCFGKNHRYPEEPFERTENADGEDEYIFTDADRFRIFAMAYNKQHPQLPNPAKEEGGMVM